MKKMIVNILSTTGISLLLLSGVALSFHAKCIYLETVFQVFGVNIITHLGIMLIQKIELRNIFTEMVLEIIFIECELLMFGRWFRWFTSISAMLLVYMGGAIYIISLFLNLLRMKQEAKELNFLIKKRNKNSADRIIRRQETNGETKNYKCYQYDIHFINDHQSDRNRLPKNRPDMDR